MARVAFSCRQLGDSVIYSKRPRPQVTDRFISDAECGRLTTVLFDCRPVNSATVQNSMDAEHPLPACSNVLVHYITVPMAVPNCCELVDYDPVAADVRSSCSCGTPCCRRGHATAAHYCLSSVTLPSRYDHRCSRSPSTSSASPECTSHHSSTSSSSNYSRSHFL